MRTVTLYSKPGCHLCDDARAVLEELAAEGRFTLQEIDIEGDAELVARYRFDIPVILADGVELARGRVDERALIAALASRHISSP